MKGALSDVTVLDLTRVLCGPFATMWLGDMGANIIKVEPPGIGDDARQTPIHVNGESTFFAALNRNKKSITLNLKHPEGKRMFIRLVEQADVVVENYRPGVMERLELGYNDLKKTNAKLIYASACGFGTYGPYKDRPAYDVVAQGMGGIMALTGIEGGEPIRVGTSIADITTGMNLTTGILAALHYRDITGEGQRLEVALVDSILALSPSENMRYFVSNEIVPRIGNRNIGNSPYGAFQCKDGFFILACGSDKIFSRFCSDVLGRPDLSENQKYSKMASRAINHNEIKAIVEDWAKSYETEEVVQILLAAGVPAGPIYNMDDISKDEYFTAAREMLVKMNQPKIGELTVTNIPIRFEKTKTEIRLPAPALGEHNSEIYKNYLCLDEASLEALKDEGVI